MTHNSLKIEYNSCLFPEHDQHHLAHTINSLTVSGESQFAVRALVYPLICLWRIPYRWCCLTPHSDLIILTSTAAAESNLPFALSKLCSRKHSSIPPSSCQPSVSAHILSEREQEAPALMNSWISLEIYQPLEPQLEQIKQTPSCLPLHTCSGLMFGTDLPHQAWMAKDSLYSAEVIKRLDQKCCWIKKNVNFKSSCFYLLDLLCWCK